MTDRLQWTITSQDGVTKIVLTGPVNEDADFAALLKDIGTGSCLRFDLAHVDRINSCGVREWVNFLRQLPAGNQLELESCSPVVVSQINMISNFAGNARILSVQAPFVCEECGHESNVVVQTQPGTSPALGETPCPKCSASMAFDDVVDSYFAFLS